MDAGNDRTIENEDGLYREDLQRGGFSDSVSFVSITSFKDKIPCGELLELSYKEKFTFHGLDQMLLIMEDIMDAADAPKPSFSHRYLDGGSYVFERMDDEKWVDILDCAGIRTMPYIRTDFSIRCSHRQHGSMQGELMVIGKKRDCKKIYFRSALELMRLMYEQMEKNIRI